MGLECVNGMGRGDHKPELPNKWWGPDFFTDFGKSEVGSHQQTCVCILCIFVVCTPTGASLSRIEATRLGSILNLLCFVDLLCWLV